MSRFLNFLRRIFRVKSPSLQKAEQYTFYKPPEWERIRQLALDKAKADVGAADQMHAYTPLRDSMTITTTSNPYSEYPTAYEEAQAMMDELHPQAAEETHEWLKKNLNLPQTEPAAVLYANDKPVITINMDGIDAFCTALRRIGQAAAEAVAALSAMVRATSDADLIDKYGTSKEIHYIMHHHKARIRKKYRNRVLRRAHRAERRNARENRTPHT